MVVFCLCLLCSSFSPTIVTRSFGSNIAKYWSNLCSSFICIISTVVYMNVSHFAQMLETETETEAKNEIEVVPLQWIQLPSARSTHYSFKMKNILPSLFCTDLTFNRLISNVRHLNTKYWNLKHERDFASLMLLCKLNSFFFIELKLFGLFNAIRNYIDIYLH